LQSFAAEDGEVGGAVVSWIYSFHMPAFVLITGYLSRRYQNSPRQIRSLFETVLLPFLIFQVLNWALASITNGELLEFHVVEARWTLWFLLALFIWRVVTPFLRLLRYPILFALAVSLLVPLDLELDATLTLGRVVGFLPYYVLGLMLTPRTIAVLKTLRFRVAYGVAGLIALAVLFTFIHDDFTLSLLYLDGSYDSDDMDPLQGMLIRPLVLLGGLLGTIAVLLLTPRHHHWFTAIGRRSLTVYLLHPLVLIPFREADPGPGAFWQTPLGVVLLVLAGTALTVVLSRRRLGRLVRPLTHVPLAGRLVHDRDPVLARMERHEHPGQAARAGRPSGPTDPDGP
jgi:fucose 4-O-acetylase-like acetyltransferase